MYENHDEVMERIAQVLEERRMLGVECSEEEIARLWYQVTLEVENEHDADRVPNSE